MIKHNILILVLLALVSCNTDVGNFQIGEDLVEAKTSVVMIDSFSIKLSTVILDSISTSSTDYALIGKYDNEIVGSVEAMHYLNFELNGNQDLITEDDIFDSITVSMQYSDYYIGDTSKIQEFSMYRLTEILEPDKSTESDYLYNINHFEHESSPIGTHRFYFYPQVSKDSIEFRIDDSLGLDIIDLVNNDETEVSSSEKFLDYLKGFAIQSTSNENLVIGFETDTSAIHLNIYTHRIGYTAVNKKFGFPISLNSPNFNGITTNRSETDFATLETQTEELPSSETNNISYLQGSVGVMTRIDFPTINSIYTYDDKVLVKAELVLRPSTINDKDLMPETLNFYTTGRKNKFGDNLVSTSSDGTETTIYANLVLDDMYPENSYYRVDITEFLLSELSGNYYDTDNGLLITLPITDLQNTIDLLILNGSGVSNLKSKMNLYFLKYE